MFIQCLYRYLKGNFQIKLYGQWFMFNMECDFENTGMKEIVLNGGMYQAFLNIDH